MVASTDTRLDVRRLRRFVPRPVQPVARRLYLEIGPATSRYRMDPGFLVIGGQRCGTTTIFKSLAEHPQVMRPPVEKGTDYYTLHHSRGLDWYRGHFPLAAPAARRTRNVGGPVAFEACTYYLFHPFAMERIAADHPDLKLVAMLRDPVERAYSAYKHELARGFETETDFVRALELEDERLDGELERMAADADYESLAHRHHAYQRRGRYAEQLARVLDHFDASQLHVMESESFFADPAAQFGRLLDFLGLNPWLPAAGFAQHNARPGAPMPEAARSRLEAYYAPLDHELAAITGRLPSWSRERS
jgi:hypothetical protein